MGKGGGGCPEDLSDNADDVYCMCGCAFVRESGLSWGCHVKFLW